MSIIRLEIIKALNGWVVSPAGDPSTYRTYDNVIVVKSDEDLAGAIAAALVSERLNPTKDTSAIVGKQAAQQSAHQVRNAMMSATSIKDALITTFGEGVLANMPSYPADAK